MLRRLILVAIFLGRWGSAICAEQPHIACFTNYGQICPGHNVDVFVHCRSDMNAAAKAACAIRSETGVQYFDASVETNPNWVGGGGYCGWRAFKVTCRNLPNDSKVEWHFDNCQGADQRNCPRNTRFFDCAVPPVQIAQSYCTKDGVTAPYQIFKYYDRGGGDCGYAGFVVGCHVPAS
jgi:hypothetical protein